MKPLEKNSSKSFILAILSFTLIVVVILLLVTAKYIKIPAFIIGVAIVIAGLVSIAGLIYGFKSVKESNSVRKIISLIYNGFVLLLFIAFIIGDLVGA